jgi:Domain of unknown function (DUF4386)
VTRSTNARIAGFAFLLYIAAGATVMMRASGPLIGIVLALLTCFSALVLGVTLHAITRDQDPDVALLGMICRVAEGVFGAMFIPFGLAVRSDAGITPALSALVLSARSFNTILSATFFAAGSTLFCWLFLRGRLIPVALAWLGLIASVVLIVGLPLQLAGVLSGSVTAIMWMPMAAFEIPLALWLLIKGVAALRSE